MEECNNDQTVLILQVDEKGNQQYSFETDVHNIESLGLDSRVDESSADLLRQAIMDKPVKLEQIPDEDTLIMLQEGDCDIGADGGGTDNGGNLISVEGVLDGMGLGMVDAMEMEKEDSPSKSSPQDDSGDVVQEDDDIIIQHMDIRQPLSTLRLLLEQRIGVELTDYEFWLQDSQMLESHKNLVDQCVQGEGLVQVNVQLKTDGKLNKINIVDVLKPAEEGEGEEESEESQEHISNIPDLSVQDQQQSHAVRWAVDSKFKKEQEKLKIPADPNDWTAAQVLHWLQWAVRHFNLVGIQLKDWAITGKELCSLTMAQFQSKVPLDPGDLFWTHLELLKSCKFVAVVQKKPKESNTRGVANRTQTFVQQKATGQQLRGKLHGRSPRMSKLPRVIGLPLGSMDNSTMGCGNRSGNNGQIQLWQFLLELLTDKDHRDVIQWLGGDGEFKLLHPETVAQLWGERKNKPTMNYEKLSRALRYYYDGDMISKVHGKRFVYKFVCDLKQLLGYSASELNALVEECERKTLGFNPQYTLSPLHT